MNFSLAAEELNVTPGAVSRQIKILEDFLGSPLFERGHREVRLTETGEAYLPALTDAFGRIDAATRRITEGRQRRGLHIWCSMTFAMRWLVPRLPVFYRDNPDRNVLFTTSLRPVDFSSGDADVAIRIGPGNWPGVVAHELVRTELMPVCSPAFIAARGPLNRVEDLAGHTLLQSIYRPNDWAFWLKVAGVPSVEMDHGAKFESSSLAYQAAIEGMGVAMGRHLRWLHDAALVGVPPGPILPLTTTSGFSRECRSACLRTSRGIDG
jgi:LysR family glycine cleavage system transcriptional activator